jgi:hypothetical protein
MAETISTVSTRTTGRKGRTRAAANNYIHTETFSLLDSSLFDQLSNPIDVSEFSLQSFPSRNKCPDCDMLMECSGMNLNCRFCGLTTVNEAFDERNADDIVSGSIKITTGASKGRYRNATSDYSKKQKKDITELLAYRQNQCPDIQISKDVLRAVADQYNLIQKLVIEHTGEDDNENDRVDKKFVKRASVKHEILAGLIHFEGIRVKKIRKKKDIAIFMGLLTYGFPHGEDILRNLEAEGLIDLPVNEEHIIGYVDRYLDALGMEQQSYINFITEIVERSEEKKIGMTSQLSSKIVGVIWILITQLNLGIAAQDVEKATDNTKKNTFMKFYKAVFSNVTLFADIFRNHGVPCVV